MKAKMKLSICRSVANAKTDITNMECQMLPMLNNELLYSMPEAVNSTDNVKSGQQYYQQLNGQTIRNAIRNEY